MMTVINHLKTSSFSKGGRLMILKLTNINKHYLQDKLEVPVLKNITFEVEAGEYVAIMGPIRFREVNINEYFRMFRSSFFRGLFFKSSGRLKVK